ncbi:MAG: dipicolinate synthase subunit DpsA [Clostridia bacterium]|nr:dipicolinate synthase subunit DpsA [Clostridia bacterium]
MNEYDKNKPRRERFSVIGGDQRSLVTAEQLYKFGYEVTLFGFDDKVKCNETLHRAKTLQDAIHCADNIILPLPCSINGSDVNTPLYDGTILLQDILVHVNKKQRILGGKLDKVFCAELETKGISYNDYTKREEFSVLNAIPTAEGAIEIALHELPVTLNGTHALVIGFGRIGKALSAALKGMGTIVTVSARRHSDLAWIKSYGYTPLSYNNFNEQLNKFHVIFNTVPQLILDRKALQSISKNCLIIDLASMPGGADDTIG